MNVAFPDALSFLFEPARYKVAYGGRGGAKSWAFADALLIQARQRPLRILCAREIQKSMKESVHQLLRDRIAALGQKAKVQGRTVPFYEVLQDEIRGVNGSLFVFAGLRHNIDNIKSKEAIDIAWIEEARTVSKASYETLIPTLRKPGSEIWVSFNPKLETDETYQRFVVKPPPADVDGKPWARIVEVSYLDNPWFPAELAIEAALLKESDPDAYATVYGGKPRQFLDGAIYANELRAATLESRITKVPYQAGKPVSTYWDLGEADMTAIWFVQRVGLEWRVIDYYENSGHKAPHYFKVVQDKPYLAGTLWLPHDAEHETMGSPKSIKRQAQDVFGADKVRTVPRGSVANGINAARTIFGECWFDEARGADGLNCLRNYRYKVDAETGLRSREPLHDWSSHGSDAFRMFAVAAKEVDVPKKPKIEPALPFGRQLETAWMG